MARLPRTDAAQFFISYAREDKAFAMELRRRLKDRGRLAWLDLKNIGALAPWRTEIAAAIDAADVFVFLISPDAVASPACLDELRFAVDGRKRLAPLVLKDTSARRVPAALRAPNWLFVRQRENLDALVDRLVKAADRDPDWIRDHGRLLVRARLWLQHRRDASRLLKGNELQHALTWLSESGRRGDRPVSRLHAEYIESSRQADAAAAARQRELYLKALARQLAAQSELTRGSSEHPAETSALLAIESLRRWPTVEGDRAMRRSLALVPRPPLARIGHHRDAAHAMAHDGSVAAVATRSSLRLIDVASGADVWRVRTGGKVRRVTFGPASQSIVVRAEGSVALHRVSDGAHVGRWHIGKDPWLMAVEPEGRLVAVASMPVGEQTIEVWAANQRAPTFSISLKEPAAAIAVFDGYLAAIVGLSPMGQTRVVAWDLTTQPVDSTPRELWSVYGRPASAAIAPDGLWAAFTVFAFGGGQPTIVHVASLAQRLPRTDDLFSNLGELRHDEPLDHIEVDDGRRLLAWSGKGSAVHVWEPSRSKLVGRFRVPGVAYRAALAEDGGSIVVAHRETGALRAAGTISRLTSDGTIAFSANADSEVERLACDAAGRIAASTSLSVTMWDSDTSSAVRQFAAEWIEGFSADSTHAIAKAPRDGSLVVPVDRSRPIIHLEQPGSVWSATFAGHGAARAVTVGNPSIGTNPKGDPHVRLWSVDRGRPMALRRRTPHTPVVVSPDGMLVALVLDDGRVVIRRIADGRVVRRLQPGEPVRALHFDMEGRHLAATTASNAVVWRVGDAAAVGSFAVGEYQYVDVFDGARDLALVSTFGGGYDPVADLVRISDGRVIAERIVRADIDFAHLRVACIADEKWVEVRQLEKGRPAPRPMMRTYHEYARTVVLAPDGVHVASAGADGSVRLWQLADGSPVARLDHPDRVLTVRFSPDARFVATTCSDNFVRLWTWRAEDLIAEGRRRIERPLTSAELDAFLPDPETR